MSAIKKIFGGGDARDDDVMYQTEGGTSTSTGGNDTSNIASEKWERDIQSSRDIGAGPDSQGLVSKIGDTGNVSSQTAGTTASSSAVTSSAPTATTSTPAVTSTQDSNAGRNTAIAGAIAGAGTTVYASDRIEGDDNRGDVSNATYTERSYALSSDSTSGPTTSETRTAEYPTGYSIDPNAPGATQQQSSGAAAGLGLVGVAAAGAGGAAVSASSQRHGGLATSSREGHYGRPPSSPPVSPPQSPTTDQSSHFGRDAAIAGGAAAGVSAAGVAAYEATRGGGGTSGPHQTPIANQIDPNASTSTESQKVKEIESHYARTAAGAGAVSTVGAGAGHAQARDDRSQVATDSTGRPLTRDEGGGSNDDDRGRDVGAGAMKEMESSSAAATAAGVGAATALGAGAGYTVASANSGDDSKKTITTSGDQGGAEPPSGMKQGFFSKVFQGESKEQEVPIGDSNPANEVNRAGAVGGAEQVGEEGMITLVKSDDPDAPTLVVREKP